MYECPNCAANLKFDIPSQQLKCDYCGTMMNPYDFQKERDVLETTVEEEDYEVTVFRCPQCGGELLSDDTTVATFCCFCGGSTILDSRIDRKMRPRQIIPFQKTKEDCRNAYAKLLHRAFFAPDELKDKDYIERFLPIYMPYWVYNFEKEEHVAFTGKQSERSGDYVITKYYKIESDVQSKYKGITFDAASSFPDELSNAIAPFEWREARAFTPSFLSGFYADAGDVGAQVYQEDARALVQQDMCDKMQQEKMCREYELGGDFIEAMSPGRMQQEFVMLPVWFLTYRKKERVTYVAVNGQTGKAAGDIPVDKGKYLRASFLCAIPIFVLLNLFLSLKASTMLAVTAVLALAACVMSVQQEKRLRVKRLGTDDKGKLGDIKLEESSGVHIIFPRGTLREILRGLSSVIIVLVGVLLVSYLGETGAMVVMIGMFLFAIVGVLIKKPVQPVRLTKSSRHSIAWEDLKKGLARPGTGLLAAALVLVLHPVSDLYYYGAALIVMALIGWDILDMIERYNLLVSTELPQFHKRGGEENVR